MGRRLTSKTPCCGRMIAAGRESIATRAASPVVDTAAAWVGESRGSVVLIVSLTKRTFAVAVAAVVVAVVAAVCLQVVACFSLSFSGSAPAVVVALAVVAAAVVVGCAGLSYRFGVWVVAAKHNERYVEIYGPRCVSFPLAPATTNPGHPRLAGLCELWTSKTQRSVDHSRPFPSRPLPHLDEHQRTEVE